MSEKPAWRLDLGLEALAHGSIICAFLHDITREARHFSTLTNGLLTVLDNPKKKIPYHFSELGNLCLLHLRRAHCTRFEVVRLSIYALRG